MNSDERTRIYDGTEPEMAEKGHLCVRCCSLGLLANQWNGMEEETMTECDRSALVRLLPQLSTTSSGPPAGTWMTSSSCNYYFLC